MIEALKQLSGKPTVTTVDVAGVTIHLRSMSSSHRDILDLSYRTRDGIPKQDFRAFAVVGCMCEPDGTRCQWDQEDLDALKGMDSALLEPLFEAAARASGLIGTEELEGNSQAT